MIAAVYAFGAVIFVLFGSGREQPWAKGDVDDQDHPKVSLVEIIVSNDRFFGIQDLLTDTDMAARCSFEILIADFSQISVHYFDNIMMLVERTKGGSKWGGRRVGR